MRFSQGVPGWSKDICPMAVAFITLLPAEVWSVAISMSVCLSACMYKNTWPKFTTVSVAPHVNWGRDLILRLQQAICYIIPVFLWMMTYFHIMGHMSRGIGSIDVGTMLQQIVLNFQCIRQGAQTVWLFIVYNGSHLCTGDSLLHAINIALYLVKFGHVVTEIRSGQTDMLSVTWGRRGAE